MFPYGCFARCTSVLVKVIHEVNISSAILTTEKYFHFRSIHLPENHIICVLCSISGFNKDFTYAAVSTPTKKCPKPFCLPEDFQVRGPSCISVLFPWIKSSLRSSTPFFSRPWDFCSRRRAISRRRAALSYSLTLAFTCEMVSLISAKPWTRDLYSSVSAESSEKHVRIFVHKVVKIRRTVTAWR